HCSLSGCTDECATFYDNSQFTLQWCIISESLANSIHEKGAHGYGGIWGGQKASFHHNLLAHHTNRTQRLCGSRYTGKPEEEKVELFNNVIYNYGSDGAYAGEGGSYNFLNNYYKPGPYSATKGSYRRLFTAYADDGKNQNEAGVHGIFHFKGNFMDATCPSLTDKQKEALYKVNMDNTFGLIVKNDFAPEKNLLSKKAFDIAEHTSLQPAKKAYKDVLQFAGASHRRDAVDQRIVEETRKGNYTYEGSHGSTNGMVDQPIDVGGWPEYKSEPTPTDSDGDGIPDEWEKKYNLNPNDPSDGAQYGLSKEYTNLEVYLNELVNHLYPADSKK
ncbi:pectate lyase, partial [Bacteroides thetaiotaomicron]